MKSSAEDITVKLKCRDLRRRDARASRIFRFKLVHGGFHVVGSMLWVPCCGSMYFVEAQVTQ